MAFIFTMRSTPVDGNSSSTSPNAQSPQSTLSPIDEDGTTFSTPRNAPPVPPRAWNRPPHTIFGLGSPPKANHEGSPPVYSQFDGVGVEGPNGEKLADVRKGISNNKHIARRGGWRRLALIALIAVAVIVALVVGLVVGLHNRDNNSNSNQDSSGSSSSGGGSLGGASGTVGGQTNPASNTTFPAGSFSIETYLDSMNASCTSNAATWSCSPGITYATSPSGSAETFDWIISPIEGTSDYSISSAPNPFTLNFSNQTMSLVNSGTDEEHYAFHFSRQQTVAPNTAISSSDAKALCYFNQTTVAASLYTKMAKTYPSSSTADTNTTEAYTPWPYAVRLQLIQNAGAGTPTCVNPSGDSLGDFSVSDSAAQCSCLYQNTGT